MYRLDYQYTHDIDWFCRINGIPVHMASDGGHLPNCYTIDQLVSLQHRVANLKPEYQCDVNIAYLEEYLRQGEFYDSMNELSDEEYRLMLPEEFKISDDIENLPMYMKVYAWSFIEMAKKGFYSFDRGHCVDGRDVYHLVARPIVDSEQSVLLESFDDLHKYTMCCFPPYHNDYDNYNLPKYIGFHIQPEFKKFARLNID